MKADVCFSWNLKRLVLKELLDKECITLGYMETAIPDVYFGFRIYPHVQNKDNGEINVYFGMVVKSKFDVELECNFRVNANGFSGHIPYFPFVTSDVEYRSSVISAHELFDPDTGFFDTSGVMKLDVKCSLKCHPVSDMVSLCDHLLASEEKDFVVMVGGKNLEVHKNLLGHYSSVFARMFNSSYKEASANSVQIDDFEYDTVKYAIDFCYGECCPDDIFVLIDLLRFSDKYDIVDLCDEAQDRLSDLVDTSNVVFVLNEIALFASESLVSSCMKILVPCVRNQVPVFENEKLCEEMRLKLVKYLFDY